MYIPNYYKPSCLHGVHELSYIWHTLYLAHEDNAATVQLDSMRQVKFTTSPSIRSEGLSMKAHPVSNLLLCAN